MVDYARANNIHSKLDLCVCLCGYFRIIQFNVLKQTTISDMHRQINKPNYFLNNNNNNNFFLKFKWQHAIFCFKCSANKSLLFQPTKIYIYIYIVCKCVSLIESTIFICDAYFLIMSWILEIKKKKKGIKKFEGNN